MHGAVARGVRHTARAGRDRPGAGEAVQRLMRCAMRAWCVSTAPSMAVHQLASSLLLPPPPSRLPLEQLRHQFFSMEYAFRMLDTRPLPQGKTGPLRYCCTTAAAGMAVAMAVLEWHLLHWAQAVRNDCPIKALLGQT